MAPRRYRMGVRAAGVAETRESIVDAAKELHAAQGVIITSWEDIADRAGVSTATVYRHFPSLAELVPACARSVFDVIEPPTLEEGRRKFAALDTAADRMEQLVRDSCACYGKGAAWLHAAHRERDFVPELDRALEVIESSLDVLVEAAFGAPLAEDEHGLLYVLCDFPLWWSLRASGLGPQAAEEHIVRLVRSQTLRMTS